MMFAWLPLALFGHLANAAAFLVDKMLLNSAFKRSATYAVLMGSISSLIVVASPWVATWPARSLLSIIFVFGAFFVLALWSFFEAMRREEASRVVPIVGSLIPIFTWVGEWFFLGTTLDHRQLAGFFLLVLATVLFTRGSRKRASVTWTVLGLAALAAILFAGASLAGKYAFAQSDFLGVLIVSRVCGAVTALGIALIAGAAVRQEVRSILIPTKKKRVTHVSTFAGVLAVVGQLLGGVGFIMVHLAMTQGSAAIVNALQAVQYGVLVLVAWLGGTKLRAILNEDLSRRSLIQKSVGVVAVGFGLILLSMTV